MFGQFPTLHFGLAHFTSQPFIYVSSNHKLQKFTSSGELIKCVSQRGSKEGEFNAPCGVTLYDNQVYVCDHYNHRIYSGV